MARLRSMLGGVAAASALATLLAGAALADNPHYPGSGNAPGKAGTPPGQAKKGTDHALDQGRGTTKQAGAPASRKLKPRHPAHPSHPAQATKAVTLRRPGLAAPTGKGHEKTAHHKVIICHRTGSATHPYVVINVSINGWLHGHQKHGDILLKDPASPGEKADPALAARCAGGQQAPVVLAVRQSRSAQLAIPAKPKRLVVAGGVEGVSSNRPARQQPQAAGVLGAISAPVRSAMLPFTGFPLWIVVLLAAIFVGSGLLIRRLTRAA